MPADVERRARPAAVRRHAPKRHWDKAARRRARILVTEMPLAAPRTWQWRGRKLPIHPAEKRPERHGQRAARVLGLPPVAAKRGWRVFLAVIKAQPSRGPLRDRRVNRAGRVNSARQVDKARVTRPEFTRGAKFSGWPGRPPVSTRPNPAKGHSGRRAAPRTTTAGSWPRPERESARRAERATGPPAFRPSVLQTPAVARYSATRPAGTRPLPLMS